MFGLGMGEIIIIAILALLLLGPDKLPEAAKTLGKTLREVRKHTDDLKEQFEAEVYAEERGAPKPALVGPIPKPAAAPAGPPPAATPENVPGLEAAFAGDEPPPAAEPVSAVTAAEPAPAVTAPAAPAAVIAEKPAS